ncbi:MAG: EAL domain-containing protein [Gammaproteobacteria bacterium]|nr:EAL domain-containing protein [Gammaproteobacteria bacterium]
MTKTNRSLLKIRLFLGVIVTITLILLGNLFEAYTLVSGISILAILSGAIVTDRVFSRKDRHIDFLENMETVNKAINNAECVEDMLFNVLSVVQDILKTDRAWLLYPCDPHAASWKVPMEVTRPEYPGAMTSNGDVAMSEEAAQLFQAALEEKNAIFFDYRDPDSPKETVEKFAVLTQIHIALFPKTGSPWLFGVHQCSHPKVWNKDEIQLFTEISRRIGDGLTSLLYLRDLSESEQQNRTILDSTAEAIYGLDTDGNCTFCNAACLRILDLGEADELIGKNMHQLIHHTRSDGSDYEPKDCPINQTILKNKKCHVDSEILFRPNGSCFPAEYWAHPIIENGKVNGCVVTFMDITDRRQREDELSYQASHDSLTGLLNRLEFEKRLAESLKPQNIKNNQHAMLFLDLDQFKVINDTCGHAAGDELLRQICEVLNSSIRHNDILARIGGDEFAILMQSCTLEQANRVASIILDAVNKFQFVWEDNIFRIQVSIGLIPIRAETQSISELFIQADAACYLAKDAGRNRIHVYHPDDSDMAQRHGEMQWVTKIYSALEENRFLLYAQPIVSIKKQAKHHFELLLRMKDSSSRIIAPGAFLPAAERYDIIEKLDHWVIENSFRVLSESADFLENINFVSINLSGKSLTSECLLETIINNLEASNIPANKICFEITETAAIANFNQALKFINQLKLKGFRFALDDFGTGLSSFGYLKKMPVDFLKIDGLFIKEITENPIDYEFVKSINGIGHVMGMKTIAEFVENDEILETLSEIGVDYAQGYALGKPVPLESLIQSTGITTRKLTSNTKI